MNKSTRTCNPDHIGWAEFSSQLSDSSSKEAKAAQVLVWKRAIRATTSVSKCLRLNSIDEWVAYLKTVLVSCFHQSANPSSPPYIRSAGAASSAQLATRYRKELAKLWGVLPGLASQTVTHMSKITNPGLANNVRVYESPSAVSVGMLGSADVVAHKYSLGAANACSGYRHLFEAGAWVNGEFRQITDELKQADSPTTLLLLSLGAPDAVLRAVRAALATSTLPAEVDHRWRQVYVTLADGTEAVISPVPNVKMLSFLIGVEAPVNEWLDKHEYMVGGANPGNAAGLAASAAGRFKVLKASVPLSLRPQERDVLSRIFQPHTLLAWPHSSATNFLLQDTASWPNHQRAAYVNPLLDALLEQVSAPLLALLDYVSQVPATLQEPELKARIERSESPLLALVAGKRDKGTQEGVAELLAKKVLDSLSKKLKGKSIPQANSRLLALACQAYAEDGL